MAGERRETARDAPSAALVAPAAIGVVGLLAERLPLEVARRMAACARTRDADSKKSAPAAAC